MIKYFQPKHAKVLTAPISLLNAAVKPEEMNIPGWGWHSLKGELAEQYAVWVNANWRLTFKFEGQDAILVDYQDYH